MSSESNTALVYLYRDAHNYQEWGEIVFAGKWCETYGDRLRAACEHGQNFAAHQVGVPTVFLYDDPKWEFSSADHGWHEFFELRATDEVPTDAGERSIEEFVDQFEDVAAEGWVIEGP